MRRGLALIGFLFRGLAGGVYGRLLLLEVLVGAMRPRIHSRFDSEGHVQSTLHEREQVISEREAVYSRGLSDHGRDGQSDAM